MAELLALGVSHKTAPLDLRERLSLTEGRAVGALRELTAADRDPRGGGDLDLQPHRALPDRLRPGRGRVDGARRAHPPGRDPPDRAARPPLLAARRARPPATCCRVTAGLDSMILGEAEIQGQVKRAYELALVEGATGPILNRLFRGALTAGGRAREETGISEKGVSIPSVAVELARRALGDLAERRVLVVGAGETAELVARRWSPAASRTVFVANRHYDRAIGLAQRFDGSAVRFEELPEQLEAGRHRRLRDQLAAPHRRARRARAGDGERARAGRCWRSTSPCRATSSPPAARSPGSAVHDIDDVQQIVERNASGREAEATRAERIIDAELDRFERWLASLEVVPTIAALRERGDEVVRRVLAENEGRWESLSEADRERLETMAKAIASRLLHEPTLRMQRARPAPTTPTSTSAPCASCSASTSRPSPRPRRGAQRHRAAPQEPRAPACGGAADRDPGQRAGADPGAAGSPSCSAGPSWSRSPPTASRATRRASCAGSSGRCSAARPRSASTRPRTCRRRWPRGW